MGAGRECSTQRPARVEAALGLLGGVRGSLKGVGGVMGALVAGRECRYSGASRVEAASGGIGGS